MIHINIKHDQNHKHGKEQKKYLQSIFVISYSFKAIHVYVLVTCCSADGIAANAIVAAENVIV